MLYTYLLQVNSVGGYVEEDSAMFDVPDLAIPRLFDDEHWQQCVEDYLLSRYDKSESIGTFRIYRLHLRRFFTDPRRTPDDYTPHEVSVFLRSSNARNGEPIAGSTYNQRYAVLARFYRYAAIYPVKQETGKPKPLFTDIAPTVSIQPRKSARNYKAFAADELERFFRAIEDEMSERASHVATQHGLSFDLSKFAKMDDGHKCAYIKQLTAHSTKSRIDLMYPFVVYLRDKALFYLYLTSARRRREIRSLQWQDIEKTTFVEHGIARKGYLFRFHGKGHGQHMDACEMAGSAYELILRYLTFSGRMIESEDYLFCGPMSLKRGGRAIKPMSDATLQSAFRRYANRAGIPRSRTIHSFRHSSARIRREQGADIESIRKVLRHKSLATTSLYLDELISPPDPDVGLIENQFKMWK